MSRLMLAILILSVPGACLAAVDVVRDGQPAATIIIAEDATQQVKAAAGLLASCVEESTGAKLAIQSELPDAGSLIYVGSKPDSCKLDHDGLDDDGFDIAFPDARTIVILGPSDYGTEYGVCEFLERYLGVRWLLPGEDGTDIPAHETISIDAEPVREEPAFFSRLFSGLQGGAQAEWARRNRMHGRISFHHHLIEMFPPETYTKTHPEFFPEKTPGQERYLPPTNASHGWQPCFTAPGIVEEAIRIINEYFDKNPGAYSYSLGTNDSSGYCRCENCLARISGEDNFLGRTDFSDLFYSWANEVIEGVLEKHPDKWFGCLAYSEVASPPKNVTVHPRLIPYMTYDRMKWVDPEIRATGEQTTRDWHAKSPTLGWYDYIYGTPYVAPRVWFHHMGDYYRFGHDNGVRALYAEAYPNWGEGPKLYISLKLQWDPTRDVTEMLDEWYERCVGAEAAPFLKKYYSHWEDFWTRRILDSDWFSKGGQYLSFYDPSFLVDVDLAEIKQCREWLDLTVDKAETDQQKARAELLRRAFEYYEATAYAYKADDFPQDQPITTDAQALKLLAGAADGVEYSAKRRQLALEEFPNDPVLLHPLAMDRSPATAGASWGAGALWRVYDMAAKEDGPVRAKLRDMAANSESELVRGQAKMMLGLIDSDLQPLTTNHSFEEGEGVLAKDWSWWVKWATGRMLRSNDVAHSGEWSVLCEGMKRGGPNRVLPITPGQHALVCFVYAPEGQDSKGTAELSLTLRDEKGNNLPSVSSKIVPAPGQWTSIAIAQDVPAQVSGKDVKSVMPILVVNGFEPGEKLYVDDIMLYRMDQ